MKNPLDFDSRNVPDRVNLDDGKYGHLYDEACTEAIKLFESESS
jgi:hypothetical protein